MKNIIIYLYLFFSGIGYSQNIDSIEFYLGKSINDYRLENKIDELKFDSTLYVVSKNHSLYLKEEFYKHNNKKVSHNQSNKDNIYYKGETPYIRCKCSEIVQINFTSTDSNDKEIANSIFELWLKSPSHNKLLLNNNYKFYAPSVIIKKTTIGIRLFSTVNVIH